MQNLQSQQENLPADMPSSLFTQLGSFVCGRSGALLSIDEDQAESLTEVDREPVNPDLPSQNNPSTTPETSTTKMPSSTTAADDAELASIKERLKDRKCIRHTSKTLELNIG